VAARRPVTLAAWAATIAVRPAASPLMPTGLRGAGHELADGSATIDGGTNPDSSSLGLHRLHRPAGP
jgi:hypothetical protein